MREIKFRGKRIDNGEWVYGYYIEDGLNNHYIVEIKDNKDKDYYYGKTYRYVEVIPETIGQFTGVYDKNNTPIYEGDLIKYACGGTEDYVIQEIDEVFFNNEYGTFEIAINKNKENSEVLGFWLADLYEDSFYQVIGNIYESEVTNEQK